jgi:hypothetical protein
VAPGHPGIHPLDEQGDQIIDNTRGPRRTLGSVDSAMLDTVVLG